jgi:hypothetical protein
MASALSIHTASDQPHQQRPPVANSDRKACQLSINRDCEVFGLLLGWGLCRLLGEGQQRLQFLMPRWKLKLLAILKVAELLQRSICARLEASHALERIGSKSRIFRAGHCLYKLFVSRGLRAAGEHINKPGKRMLTG